MKIRMYECCFGDCFRLVKKGHKDLFVDFGIHEYTCSKSEREKRFVSTHLTTLGIFQASSRGILVH